MRIIPVLDLKDGVAVHAMGGQRDTYAPVRSVLAPSADPIALARAFVTRLGCDACYVADLDAITGRGDHGASIHAIAQLGLAVWLDAGVSSAKDAERAIGHGARRVIVGTETLRDPRELPAIVAAVRAAAAAPPADCVLSLDLRDGRLLGGAAAVERLGPTDLGLAAWDAGIRAFIVLDLARIGHRRGVDTRAAHALRQSLPDAEIVVGGGARDASDLEELARQGFDAVLVATALHTGAIGS
jgi:phosphoribosylformimino-5-aminoimidazole carboxamide ribotide isomerase